MTRYLFILPLLFLAIAGTASARSDVLPDLKAEVNQDGHVVLTWTTPTGQLPSSYQIARGNPFPDKIIAQIYDATTVQFTDYNVVAGATYTYYVAAMYSDNSYVSDIVTIKVVPPAGGLEFVSRPGSTAMVGSEYVYAPSVDATHPERIAYMLINEPDGMTVKNVVGGAYVSWVPDRAGEYSITLVATDVYAIPTLRAIQEFTITVADQPGSIRGVVRTLTNDSIAEAQVRFWSVAANGKTMKFHGMTGEDGSFFLEHVQPGRIYAFCDSPLPDYESQWYINGHDITSALERTLKAGDTLNYEFYLLPKSGAPAPVSGRVTDENGSPITGAHVSFIRKERFIHIGDTASINSVSMESQAPWRSSVVDTFLITDFNGQFGLVLPAGSDYYTFVEKDGYLGTFIADQTNAMQARAMRIDNSGSTLNYTLQSTPRSVHQIFGQVRSQATGVSKQATIILINSEMKTNRGAGGGHTYRTYKSIVTDSNGVFQFKNLDEGASTSLLAIPMDPHLAPQYYHESGGRLNFVESADLPPNGTRQNIDFDLREANRSGIGSFYGKVILRRGSERIPLPGALIFVERESTAEIAGYAITDSMGTYAVTGIDPDTYLLYADHPAYNARVNYSAAQPTKPMPIGITYVRSTDANRLSEVDFYIDDLTIPVGVDTRVTPESVVLYQNFPNPFNPSTKIHFSVPHRRHVTLRVYTALGEEVAVLVNEEVDAGFHAVDFDAQHLPSGIYFYQLQSGTALLNKRMMLVK
ncbi:MAG: T9SS type A sorting domain-containing protein [Bacteroidetes bacterium]|nr:T9SS type A sorting domain-containing protein [Bacteroidota bacterium]